MFRRTNQQNRNQDPHPQDENVRKEAELQDEDQKSILAIGNEAMNSHPLAGLLTGANENDELDLSGDPDNLIRNEDDPHNIINENHPPKKQKSGNKEQAEQLIENAPQQDMEKALDIIDGDNGWIDDDMLAARPIKKKVKKKSNDKKPIAEALPESNLEGMQKLNEDMGEVRGWNFTPASLPGREKVSGWRKFLSGLAWYSGKTLGKLLTLAGTILTFPYALYKWGSKHAKGDVAQAFSKKKRHDLIPGWNGAEFKREEGEKDDIMADFRRVPTVWSRLIAEKAVDENGKEVPPTISVNVNPPDLNKDQTMIGTLSGHSGIGIEYSRQSKVTGRWERYSLKYGFFTAGDSQAGGMMSIYKDAVVPGQLMDESRGLYKITRTFKATKKQVNDVMKASETWADKGYNPYTRNCTTFVKEMVQDVAHLPVGREIFAAEDIRFSSAANAGMMLSASVSPYAHAQMRENLAELSEKEDLSYAGMGNKRVTKTDFENFDESLKKGYSRRKVAVTPNTAAQNMLRLTGPDAGEISANKYGGNLPLDSNGNIARFDPGVYRAETITQALALKAKINEITPPELQDPAAKPERLRKLLSEIDDFGLPFKELASREKQLARGKGSRAKPAVLGTDYNFSADEIRNARSKLSENTGKLNELLSKYYKNDKRLIEPVLNYISILKRGQLELDELYRRVKRNGDRIRKSMSEERYEVTAGGKAALFTPTHYESYLQIYKTPKEAVAKYKRFMELKGRSMKKPGLTDEENYELSKLERMEQLAGQFDTAHNYLLEKDSFKQQDIDYAFSLGQKENKDAGGEMIRKRYTASGVYQNLMLEKIFGDMNQRFTAALENGRISNVRDYDSISVWLDEDMSGCLTRKKDGMKMILRGMWRSLDKPDEEKMLDAFRNAVDFSWLRRIFTTDVQGDLRIASENVPLAFNLLFDKSSATRRLVEQMIQDSLEEQH